MSRSLFSAVSGLRNHQAWLDVIGNNIANANTPGYKSSSVVFQDILSQTLSSGSAPSTNLGGVNPMQVGLGVTMGTISPSFLQGSLQTTNRNTDVAIQGDGFFAVANGNSNLYTRSGAFTLDANGDLVEGATGYKVQGTAGAIRISQGQESGATPTANALLKGNLDFSVATGTDYTTTFSVRDSVGGAHTLTATFTKAAADQWDWAVTASDASISAITTGTGSITFDSSGAIATGGSQAIGVDFVAGAGVADPQAILLDFGTSDNTTPITGLASASTVTLGSQDGLGTGSLQSFAIGSDGTITGFYSNGTNKALGTMQLAVFNNPAGLLRVGQNHFQESAASGVANTGNPGTGGRGSLTPGSLEQSNVDLAQEFTSMMLAQTGFQANARTIQTSDQMLQELVNMRR